MKNPRLFLRALGIGAFVIFALMALILQVWIAPNVSFLPQAELAPYSDADLLALGAELRDQGLARLYKFALLILDPIFIVAFGLWVMLMHVTRGSTVWSLLGVALAGGFMALDFSEDLMLAVRLGLSSAGLPDPAQYSAEVSRIHSITLAKYAVFAACLISTVIVSRKPRA